MDKLERQMFGLAFGVGIFLPFLQYFFWQVENTGEVCFKQQDVFVGCWILLFSLCVWVCVKVKKTNYGRDLFRDRIPQDEDLENDIRSQEQTED
jgi:hypothetical protein